MDQNQKMTKKTVPSKGKAIVIGITTLLIIISSLIHTNFDEFSDDYLEHKKNYKSLLIERLEAQDSLAKELGKSLTIQEYQKLRVEAWELSKRKLKAYTLKKK